MKVNKDRCRRTGVRVRGGRRENCRAPSTKSPSVDGRLGAVRAGRGVGVRLLLGGAHESLHLAAELLQLRSEVGDARTRVRLGLRDEDLELGLGAIAQRLENLAGLDLELLRLRRRPGLSGTKRLLDLLRRKHLESSGDAVRENRAQFLTRRGAVSSCHSPPSEAACTVPLWTGHPHL